MREVAARARVIKVAPWITYAFMAATAGSATHGADESAQRPVTPVTMTGAPILPGESVTLLPNGTFFLTGGESDQGILATIVTRTAGTERAFPAALEHARSGHTATVLPDGRVLVFGGVGSNGELVQDAEIIDVEHEAVQSVSATGLVARTQHTATLLTSGRVLIAGGRDASGNALGSAQLWDPKTASPAAAESELLVARYAHEAALLASGEGLISGGVSRTGVAVPSGEIYNPSTNLFEGPIQRGDPRLPSSADVVRPLAVADTVPTSGSVDVPLNTEIGVRFSRAAPIGELNAETVTLVGPRGAVSGKVVGAEGGMLAFFTPDQELLPATFYTLFVRGVRDASGVEIALTSIAFTTHRITVVPVSSGRSGSTSAAKAAWTSSTSASGSVAATAARSGSSAAIIATHHAEPPTPKPLPEQTGPEDWIPRAENRHGAWRVLGLAGDPALSTQASKLALPSTAPNSTGVSGRILRLNGLPIAGVSVSVDSASAVTDVEGRFALTGLTAGAHLLRIDGRGVVSNGRHYTEHYLSVSLASGHVTALANPIYLPRVDPATEVSISSPADHDIVLTHSAIPGLEVRIPKGAVLRERDGSIVRTVSITPVPVDRAPYRTPVPFTVYFTLQPGGAYVDGDPSKAIKVTYPNYQGLAPGTSADFWNYDVTVGGWQRYGHGKVSKDGKRVVADESVGFREIMSFGIGLAPNSSPPPNGPTPNGCHAGDPVDCATGVFSHTVPDLVVSDVIPISLTRIYRTNDNQSHAFGVGAGLSYSMYLYTAPANTPTPNGAEIDIVRGDGSRIQFFPAPGTQQPWINTNSPTEFNGAVLTENGGGPSFDVKLRDGTVYRFYGEYATGPNSLYAIIDRNGNQVTITTAPNGNIATSSPITQITSPSGRYIQLFYDSLQRVIQAVDNSGRSTSYTYDSAGHLASATDANGHTESYGYDPTTNNMNLVTDKRGNSMVKNLFDVNGRVSQQTLADGAIWKFTYALNSAGSVTQTTITDPRNYVRQETFNASGYTTNVVLAVGQPEQQTYSIVRDTTNFALMVTDALGRQTLYGYDAVGDLTSVTPLYGTGSAVTYTMIYDATYHQLTSITDPLGHTTQATLDSHGNAISVADPIGNVTTFSYGRMGLPTSITDALGHTTQLVYVGADLAGVIDPLSRQTLASNDALGRPRSITDPLGHSVHYSRDAMDRVTSVTNVIGGVTGLAYDNNGNLLTVTDPRNVVQTFTYDSRNRRHTYQDPAGKLATYNFDGLSNLTSLVDRKNQTTAITYDGINRPTKITFQDGSTITITWDGGNRATTFVDSINGTISRTYDLLDRLTQEITPQGQVNYTYDSASRRATMTVAGQAVINYTFDNDDRLTQVVQGTTSLGFGFDTAGRRTTITLPNGIAGTLSFDNANELTGITYMSGSNSVGTLGYTYDLDGRRTSVAGTLAGYAPPYASSTMTFDATNRLTSLGGTSLSYDANGNVTNFGSVTYTWNARNQLTAVSSGNASFSYDAVARRVGATISGTMTPYLYDGSNAAMVGTAQLLTGAGLDELYAQISSTGTVSFLKDGINSTVATTNASASITSNNYYSPYGDSAGSGTTATPSQFTGRENDGATMLYYYRARYYSPQLGRFLSEDPLGPAGGTNFYAYVNGDPIDGIDPLGLYTGVSVTLPNGTQYVPVTYVKNAGQAKKLGLKIGTLIPIAVPIGVCPQDTVEEWAAIGATQPWSVVYPAFFNYWRPNGEHDYKNINPIYDAYGNFGYGATAAATGIIPQSVVQSAADAAHGGLNYSINSQDIQSGYNAIENGGTLGTFEYTPPQ